MPDLYLEGRDSVDRNVMVARDRAETISVRFRVTPKEAKALWALLVAAAKLNTPWPAVPITPAPDQIIETRPIEWHEHRHNAESAGNA